MLFFDEGLTGRFAAAPGFVLGLLEEGLALGFGGAMMTGPPSLRLMESQISGNRAAKLVILAKGEGRSSVMSANLQRHNDVSTEVL